ncbi:MAG: HAD family hydrolase [Deltaproteobacteria bacterium]|nr:HAD family hydrolase [Deltaproteobacteria bacterium]
MADPTGRILTIPQAVIFDFEGTLVDFQWRLAEAEAEATEVLVRLQMLEPGEKLSYAEMMNRVLSEDENPVQPAGLALLSEIYDRYDAEALGRWRIRPGALEALEQLKARGLKTGLVSNVGRAVLDAALERVGLISWLDETVSRNEAGRLKPDPAGIIMVCERLHCSLNGVLYVGDSLDDIRAAKEAGVPVAVIQGGQDRLPEIDQADPSWIIKELAELTALLDNGRKLDF